MTQDPDREAVDGARASAPGPADSSAPVVSPALAAPSGPRQGEAPPVGAPIEPQEQDEDEDDLDESEAAFEAEDVDQEVALALSSEAVVEAPPILVEEEPEHTPTVARAPMPDFPTETPEG